MATVPRTNSSRPLRCWRRAWVIVTLSIVALAGGPALAVPPEWAHKKPPAPTTTQATTTTAPASTTTEAPTTTTTEGQTTTTTTEPATTTTVGGVVCTASGECGDWVSEAPIVCFNELGEMVAVLDSYDYDNPLLADPSLICSSGY